MKTLVFMVALLGGISAGLMAVVALLTCVMTLPDLIRVARVLRAKPSPVSSLRAGADAVVQGLVVANDTPSLQTHATGAPVVFRKLIVSETVGTKTHERYVGTQSVRFEVDDGRARVTVDPLNARLMSPGASGGQVTDAVLDHTGPVYAWDRTPKHYIEQWLAPGDFVTVSARVARDGRTLEAPLWILRGEPRLLATEEARTVLISALLVPVGAAACVAGFWYMGLV